MSERFFAPAKINLLLDVFAPDATGYHPLDTLFCALDLADEIAITAHEPGIQLAVTGADVGPGHANLAYRAAVEFYQATGLAAGIHIRLTKNIPAGAGLGGGSSDAATVLSALNQTHGNVLPPADLLALAARLGSDVAFFLCGSSFAHATGRGEIVRALPPLAPPAALILLVPGFGIATRDAYRWLDDDRAYSQSAAPSAVPGGWHEIASVAHNAFEPVVFRRHPELAALKAALQDAGASPALLSGSGSALFGIYDSVQQRDGAAQKLKRLWERTPRADPAHDVAVITTATRT